jgi:DNA primase
VLFPGPNHTKLDLARYYVAVAEGALRGAGGRPNVLVRYPDGIEGEFFYQNSARRPRARSGSRVAAIRFPSGREAEEIVPRDAAALVVDGQHGVPRASSAPVRAEDLDHPDELRVDLDLCQGSHGVR